MKYNKSEIMKKAWSIRKVSMNWVSPLSFADCLRRAWAEAKKAARQFCGIVRNVQVAGTLMHPITSTWTPWKSPAIPTPSVRCSATWA